MPGNRNRNRKSKKSGGELSALRAKVAQLSMVGPKLLSKGTQLAVPPPVACYFKTTQWIRCYAAATSSVLPQTYTLETLITNSSSGLPGGCQEGTSLVVKRVRIFMLPPPVERVIQGTTHVLANAESVFCQIAVRNFPKEETETAEVTSSTLFDQSADNFVSPIHFDLEMPGAWITRSFSPNSEVVLFGVNGFSINNLDIGWGRPPISDWSRWILVDLLCDISIAPSTRIDLPARPVIETGRHSVNNVASSCASSAPSRPCACLSATGYKKDTPSGCDCWVAIGAELCDADKT